MNYRPPLGYLEAVQSGMCGLDWPRSRSGLVVIVLGRQPIAPWSFGHAGFHHDAGVAEVVVAIEL